MSQFPLIRASNAPTIGAVTAVPGQVNTPVPMMQPPQQQQSPLGNVQQMMQMKNMYNDISGMFGGGAGVSQAPGLQASGATTAGLSGAQAAPLATATPLSAGGAGGAGAGSGVAAAGPWAALAAMFLANEKFQGSNGGRDDGWKDTAKMIGSGGYSDMVNALESPVRKVRDEAFTPAKDFLNDDIYTPVEDFFKGLF